MFGEHDPEDPWLRKGQHSPIEFERLQYMQTKNPIHLWRAYRTYRELMTAPAGPVVSTLPDWIFDYLDQIEARIHELYCDGHGDGERVKIGAELADIMGFKDKGQGVRSTAFTSEDLARRDRRFASFVRNALRDRGLDPNRERPTSTDVAAAVTNVAENLRETAASYRAAIAEDLLPERDSFLDSVMRRKELKRLEDLASFDESTIRRAWEEWNDFLAEFTADARQHLSL